jgi:hypothetical protein
MISLVVLLATSNICRAEKAMLQNSNRIACAVCHRFYQPNNDKTMTITFNKKIITAALGITATELEYLTEELVVPTGERGEYDIDECIKAYNKYLANEHLASKANSSLGDLVPIDEIIFDMKDKIIRFRIKMLQIPYRVAGLCGRLKDRSEVERFMRQLIEEALAELTPLDCTKYMR